MHAHDLTNSTYICDAEHRKGNFLHMMYIFSLQLFIFSLLEQFLSFTNDTFFIEINQRNQVLFLLFSLSFATYYH